ncbi:MAG TPA: isocitrate dehydrogenase kinase/phosphatase AceK regulatory subunit [Steroidobacteraceae bacterium]|jgi:isocitrate dehydrogenase kinase/phosphatase|nr:isocitrate dehydrogenase kinase/phosphatase AceK regulatory subunit [Steroidobacteraceae bacterium]
MSMIDSPVGMVDCPVELAYARLAGCSDGALIAATARLILAIFDDFYGLLCEYPYRAKCAFELMDPHASIRISQERLGLYSRYIAEHGPRILRTFPALSDDAGLWEAIDRLFVAMIVDRYEADTAFSFAHSLRRNICNEVWRPVAYSFPPPSKLRAFSMASVHRRLPIASRIDAELIATFLRVPGFQVPFRDLTEDSQRIVERVEALLSPADAPPVALDVVEAGFFRDRSAFVVGRWVRSDDSIVPFVVALLNSDRGIYADAVLHRVADIHSLFSSALANFHVTTRLYYQTCVFLYSLMPRRPLGHHYSTIGFNHVGKVAILNEMTAQLRASGQRLRRSPGAAGTVAVGFTFDACSYHLKVIRDRPTSSYKWGSYPGVAAVAEKYRLVHEINRAGSMLDNVMYFNLRLDRDMFDPEFLEELCRESSESVHVHGDGVTFRTLIMQLKIIPLPVYLENASESETREVIINLGRCIRNNAATNIFNRDLDSRNYGVGRYGRVFLFDYDAVEKLTDVKIRTNMDREPGEETVPEWFFEEGVVFLPEELQHGMQLMNRYARNCFREENLDLLSVAYWQDVQQKLLRGEVPALQMYPDACRLDAADGTQGQRGFEI